MRATFKTFDNSSNWVDGTVGPYTFSAKLFDTGSSFGIDGGRVSKLSIQTKTKMLVNYDRGWDIKPTAGSLGNQALKAVLKLCENSPKRFA